MTTPNLREKAKGIIKDVKENCYKDISLSETTYWYIERLIEKALIEERERALREVKGWIEDPNFDGDIHFLLFRINNLLSRKEGE